MRTHLANIVAAKARKAADQLDEYWFHLRSQDTKLLSKHILALGVQDDAILPPNCPNR
ncbi:hypothetical protein [Ruegeria sp. HKCCA4008]|uniref:hypothetical protein n=1 Tax=Ruegeria sp. HKCCA4008 TaxID=2682999 RepID=UPI003530503C